MIELEHCYIACAPKCASTWVKRAIAVSGLDHRWLSDDADDFSRIGHPHPSLAGYDKPLVTFVRHPYVWLRSLWRHRQLHGAPEGFDWVFHPLELGGFDDLAYAVAQSQDMIGEFLSRWSRPNAIALLVESMPFGLIDALRDLGHAPDVTAMLAVDRTNPSASCESGYDAEQAQAVCDAEPMLMEFYR